MTAPTKAAKAMKNAVEAPFEAFNMNVPTMEVPAAFRDLAEKSIAQARDTYAKFKSAAEEATDVVEDAYENARTGAVAIGVKTLEAAKSNTDASFAFARDLFGARTFAEMIEIQTAFARQQFDAVAGQMKEFQDLTAKVVADAAKPVTAQVEKTFREIKAS
jgi:phasin